MAAHVPFASKPAAIWQRAWRRWVVLAIWLGPAQALAIDWTPILRSGSPAPGAPGRTVDSIDTGRYVPSAPPLIDENGRLIFLAWIDGAPAGESAGRLYQWTSQDGLSLKPPAPLSMLDAGCEFGVDSFVGAQNGAYALHARSVGEHFSCNSGALLIPDGAEGWSELLPTPESGPTWVLRGAGPVGINQHSEVLVKSSENFVCLPEATICSAMSRQVLYLADPSGATLIYRETAAAPGVAGDAQLGPLFNAYGIDGPNALGQVVAQVPVYVDGESPQALYRWDPDAGLELIALQGDAAPGIPNAVIDHIGAPVLDDAGAITFWGRLAQGPGVDESNDDAIWTRSPSGVTELRFRESTSTGPIVLPLLVNEMGGVAFVTAGDRTRIAPPQLWGPDGEGNLVVRTSEEELTARRLYQFDTLHLDDAGRLLIRRRNSYYMVDELDVMSVLVNGADPIELAPGEFVVPTTAHLAFDHNLEHFALGVWTQDPSTSEKTTTMLVPVPEPSASQGGLVAVAVLALLRRGQRARSATAARRRSGHDPVRPESPQARKAARVALLSRR